MLTDQELKQILTDWSFWDSPPPNSLQRKLTLPSQLSNDLLLIVQGVRRAGKSTLLTQLPEHYQLPLVQCYYCNFEDPRLLNHFFGLLQFYKLHQRKDYPVLLLMLLLFFPDRYLQHHFSLFVVVDNN
ncbi:MAG: AAA family ATPase [Gammaproteobacteria bacterium]|nr:AAA family ATPase [Gammaproteobacteria bacterium]